MKQCHRRYGALSDCSLALDTVWGYAHGAPNLEVQMRGYTEDKQELQRRLRRIEGQVRGLQRMVDEDAYCIDVLTQISAATKALQSVALELLDDHLGHCVREAIADGGPDAEAKVAEASAAIARLVRS
jgi:CsoR family transcriptional regulator, copper-sensing transcriptional repressor